MVFPSHLLATALLAVALSTSAEGCDCFPFWGQLCDRITPIDIVIRATILNRTESVDTNEDTIYSLQSVDVFKSDIGNVSDSDAEYAKGSTFDIAMPGNDGLCGIFLEIGEDYLMDLNRSEDEELESVGLCGLTQEWSSVDAEDEATLLEGCDDYDPCEGACDEFQECAKGFSSSVGYYCEASCGQNPCGDEEECVLAYSTSCDQSDSCALEATCKQASQSDVTPSPMVGSDSARTPLPSATIDSSTGGDAVTPSPTGLDATSSPIVGSDSARTPPPGATIDSSTGGDAVIPSPTGLDATPSPMVGSDSARTPPPGATIDSSTSGDTVTPSPTGMKDIAQTLAPGGIIKFRTSMPTPSSDMPRDVAMTLPPGTSVDSTSGVMTTASPTGLRDIVRTLPPGASIDSTMGAAGTPYPSELTDVAMTPSPGVSVDLRSSFDTMYPTFPPTVVDRNTDEFGTLSPTVSPTSIARGVDIDGETAAPSVDPDVDETSGAPWDFRSGSGVGWHAACGVIAAVGAGVFGDDFFVA